MDVWWMNKQILLFLLSISSFRKGMQMLNKMYLWESRIFTFYWQITIWNTSTLILKVLSRRERKWKWKWLSLVWLFATPWPIQSMELQNSMARILEWTALPFSRGLPNPGIEARSLALQVDSLPAELELKSKFTRILVKIPKCQFKYIKILHTKLSMKLYPA